MIFIISINSFWSCVLIGSSYRLCLLPFHSKTQQNVKNFVLQNYLTWRVIDRILCCSCFPNFLYENSMIFIISINSFSSCLLIGSSYRLCLLPFHPKTQQKVKNFSGYLSYVLGMRCLAWCAVLGVLRGISAGSALPTHHHNISVIFWVTKIIVCI